ncbi:dTDP-4-dehydrorhamnose 3,5-epimerase [uncultured Devosia sp.]|uniref:dTDP-4-dehydrorhamnose 3,5-epimerase n=1 Tax=uncultured Devosia sp. TaxID=211434 RepID=UPI0035CC191A
MQAHRLRLPDVVEVSLPGHPDERGYFREIFREDWFAAEVAPVRFVQENQSLSLVAGIVRGLHFQTAPAAQGKLVRCVTGSIFDVAVDIRPASRTFGQWIAVTLSAEKGNQLCIPAGFAHGFCTLEPNTTVCYKVTAFYSKADEGGIAWNDQDLGVAWPHVALAHQLSPKDKLQPRLRDLFAGLQLGTGVA